MSDILVRPNQLRSTAGNLRTSASSIMNSIQRVDLNLNGLSAQIFEGISANVLQANYQTKRESVLNLFSSVLFLAEELEKIASFFESADEKIQDILKPNSPTGPSTNIKTDTGNQNQPAGPQSSNNENNSNNKLSPEPLSNVERINGESCAQYAQERRPNLGHAGGDGGAYNYINRPGVFQITNNDNDLTKKIAVGYAVIWNKGDPGLKGTAGYDMGHVAIVEAVEGNKIEVSQANWPGHDEMWVNIDQLQSSYLYILP